MNLKKKTLVTIDVDPAISLNAMPGRRLTQENREKPGNLQRRKKAVNLHFTRKNFVMCQLFPKEF